MELSGDASFATRLAELIRDRGVTYRGLAAKTLYSRGYIHDLARGRKVGTEDAATRLDQALAAGGDLVRRYRADKARSQVRQAAGHTDDVRRRSVVLGMAALGTLPVRDIIAALTDRSRGYTTVAGWQEITWRYGFDYQSVPREALLQELAADLAALEQQLQEAAPDTRSALAECGARLAALMAMACDDLGRAYEARSAWRLGRSLADTSGVVEAQAWVRGQEATLGLYSGRSLDVVIGLADRGLGVIEDGGSVGRALLLGARAQALAWSGRAAEAAADLDQLRRHVDGLPPAVTAPSDSIALFQQHRVLHCAAFVSANCGPPALAAAAAGEAVAALPPSRVISRCQLQLHEAVSTVRDGHTDDGLAQATTAIHHLAPSKRGRLVHAVAESVVRAVPAEHRSRRAFLEFDELMAGSHV